MGNVSSRPDDGSPIFIKDQARFSVAGVTVTGARNRTLLHITPNAFPASSYSARRDLGDDSPVDYIQDTDSATNGAPPTFILRLPNCDELSFTFTLVLRQQAPPNGLPNASSIPSSPALDTQLAGLTYVFAPTAKEVDTLVTREFHVDPNLHKNPNVQLVGDYATGGSPSAQFNWTWRWQPPKQTEDRSGGWRTSCSFVEYDQRAHKLNTLAGFSFWVQNTQRYLSSPISRSPGLEAGMPTRLRVPSAQSIESRISAVSDSDGEYKEYKEPQSPMFEAIPEHSMGLVPMITSSTAPGDAVKVDVYKPGEDPSASEDGPLFRATMKSLEQKTGNMRQRMKKVLRAAEAAESAQKNCNDAMGDFMDALRDASSSNANAVRPALDHYFEKIAKEILRYEQQNTINLQKYIIDPISKLYNFDIKQADFKKRDFDEESKDYYAFVSKYLGQRSESLKEKKQKESDNKYQAKRRTFELKRFDYSNFMHDLHGGRKDQEVLSQLTRYADAQAKGYLSTGKKVEAMVPQLDALCAEVAAADKDYQLQRSERELKRREIEKSAKPDESTLGPSLSVREPYTGGMNGESSRAVSYGNSPMNNGALSTSPPQTGSLAVQAPINGLLSSPGGATIGYTSPNNKFKGIRDLEENNSSAAVNGGQHRKEGLLWALSRPGSHVDPKGLNKTAWHKFWIVLDQGKLSEYVNWKDKLDLHMDPIDLRMASVREARNSDRRFCFEIITPQFTRVYQAPSEDDMKFWIAALNNALQSAFEARDLHQTSPSPSPQSGSGSTRKDIAAVLTGKSSSFSGHRATSSASASQAAKAVNRHATTGDKPLFARSESEPSALLQRIRNTDEGNKICADCGSENKVDWTSINLGILLCIECSGIHRSLGTHISKVRSLTLDTSVFTPDLVEILLLIGNRVSNMVWEAKLDLFLKPSPHSTREQRLHFISAKYSERTYVQNNLLSHSPDELLLTSIKRNDIQNVLLALALRANPNAADRSRSTHAVFLALVAADPASPAGSSGTFSHSHSSSTSSLHAPSTTGIPTPSRKPFPVAELLLQNGADVPPRPAPIPLSRAAQLYLEFKNEQRLGRNHVSGTKDGNGDTLSALPTILAGNGSSPSERSREREARLLKRHSSGRPARPSIAADAIEGFAKK